MEREREGGEGGKRRGREERYRDRERKKEAGKKKV